MTVDAHPVELWGTPILDVHLLSGIVLRYSVTDVIASAPGRIWTPREIAAVLEGRGFRSHGRLAKAVSDGLRAEVNRGRVHRVGRGRYTLGHIPGSTRRRIRAVVRHRAELVAAEPHRFT